MKKLLLSLFIVLIVSSAHAQLRLGLTASPGISWFKTDSKLTNSEGVAPGLTLGLLLDVRIGENERYAFSSGLALAMCGGNLERTIPDADTAHADTMFTFHNQLQYVNIPLTFRMRTNEIGYITYYGQFGITPGINIRARGTTDRSPGNSIAKENYNPEIGLFNMSLSFGGGIEYSLSESTALLLGIYFDSGFLPVVDKKEDTFLDKDEANTRTVIKNLGIKIGIFF